MTQLAAPPVSEASLRHPGLVCRKCGCQHFHTLYTRRRNNGVARRKACRNCGRRVTTYEKII